MSITQGAADVLDISWGARWFGEILAGGREMDPELSAQITKAVSQGISTSAWWLSFFVMTVTIAVSCISAYLIAYGKRKGENFATKEDFNDLLDQVKRTTEATKQIESKISQATWVGQSELDIGKSNWRNSMAPSMRVLNYQESYIAFGWTTNCKV